MAGNLGDVNLVLGFDDTAIKKSIEELEKKLQKIGSMVNKASTGEDASSGANSDKAPKKAKETAASLTAAVNALKAMNLEMANGLITQTAYNKKVEEWAAKYKEVANIAMLIGSKAPRVTQLSPDQRQGIQTGKQVSLTTAAEVEEAMKLTVAHIKKTKADTQLWEALVANLKRFKEEYDRMSGKPAMKKDDPAVMGIGDIKQMSTTNINAIKAQRAELIRLRDTLSEIHYPRELSEVNRALRENAAMMRQRSTRGLVMSLDEIRAMSAKTLPQLQEQRKEFERLRASLSMSTQGNLITQINQDLNKNRIAQQAIIQQGVAVRQSFNQTSNAAANMRNMIGRAFSVYAISAFGRKLMEVRGEFELQQRSLQAILQNKAAADRIWDQNVTLALKSPFRLKEVVKATRELAAYRVEQDKLFETNKMLMDISAGLGVEMSRLILAYGQVRSASVLRGQELRQFTEAGIPLVKALSEKFEALNGRATSTAEVFDLISKRMVPFSMIDEIFKDMTESGGIFYRMQEIQAETLKGKLSNLKDAVDVLYDKLGESEEGGIKAMVDGLRYVVENIVTVLPLIKAMTTAFVLYRIKVMLTASAHAYYAKTLRFASVEEFRAAVARKSLTAKQIKAISTTNILTASIKRMGLALASNPVMLAVTGLLLLGGTLFSMSKAADSASDTIDQLNKSQDRLKASKDFYTEFEKGYKRLTNTTDKLSQELSKLTEGTDEYAKKLVELRTAITRSDNAVLTMSKVLAGGSAAIERITDVTDNRNNSLRVNLELLKEISKEEEEAILRDNQRLIEKAGKDLEESRTKKSLLLDKLDTLNDWIDHFNKVGDKIGAERTSKAADKLRGKVDEVNTTIEKITSSMVKLGDDTTKTGDDIAAQVKKIIQSFEGTGEGKFDTSIVKLLMPEGALDSLDDYLKDVKDKITKWTEDLAGYQKRAGDQVSYELEEKAKEGLGVFYNEENRKQIEGALAFAKVIASVFGIALDKDKSTKDLVTEKLKNRVKAYEDAAKAYEKYLDVFGKEEAISRTMTEFAPVVKEFGGSLQSSNLTKEGLMAVQSGILKEVGKRGTSEAKELGRQLTTSIAEGVVAGKKESIDTISKEMADLFETFNKWKEVKDLGFTDNIFESLFGVKPINATNLKEQVMQQIQALELQGEKGVELAKSLRKQLTSIDDQVIKDNLALLDTYRDFDSQITKIREDNARNVASLREQQTGFQAQRGKSKEDDEVIDKYVARIEAAIVEANKQAEQAVSGVMVTQFKESPIWSAMFDDIERLSNDTLEELYNQASEYIKKFGSKMTPEALKQITGAMRAARSKLIEINPFESLRESFKKLAKQKKELDEKMQTGIPEFDESVVALKDSIKATGTEINIAADAITSLFKEGIDSVKAFGDAVSQIDEAAGAAITTIADGAGMLLEIGGIIKQVSVMTAAAMNTMETASVVLLIIKAVIIAIQAVIRAFAAQDKKLQKQISDSERAVRRMEAAFGRLQKAREDAFNIEDGLKALNQMAKSTELQINELVRQIRLEEQRGKKTDDEAIETAMDKIAEANRTIAEAQRAWLEELGAMDLKSAAMEFTDAWATAFLNNESSMDSMMEKYDEMILNMVKKQAAMRVTSKLLKPIDDFIDKALEDSFFSPQEMAELNAMGKEAVELINNQLRGFFESFDYVMGSGKDAQGLQKGIQSMSEDTAQVMTAYLNSIRFKLFDMAGDFTSMSDSMAINNAIVGESLAELKAIATLLREMREWQSSITSYGHAVDGGRALKVIV